MKKLNDEQYAASRGSCGIDFVIAGAGAGKTSTMAEKVSSLIKYSGFLPEQILVLTFSRKSAEDMRARIASRTGEDVFAATFHSFCLDIIKEEKDSFYECSGISGDFTILDEERASKVLGGLICSCIDDFLGLPVRTVQHLLSCAKKLKHADRPCSDMVGIFRRIEELSREYEDYKIKNNLLDFDDLIKYFTIMLERDGSLRLRILSRFRYILVDEFQDTSPDCFRLLNLLLPERGANLFAVGDDWQSIYAFRNANPDYIINPRRYFPDCRLFYLTLNYRSPGKIVNLSNSFISSNKKRTSKKMRSAFGCGGHVRYCGFEDGSSMMNSMFEIIKSNISLGTVAVLFRNNYELGRVSDILSSVRDFQFPSALHLLTMHSSKGLEFDCVVIYGIDDAVIPSPGSDIEEERRLFYVALTRSRKKLFLLYRNSSGKPRFIRELKSVLLRLRIRLFFGLKLPGVLS